MMGLVISLVTGIFLAVTVNAQVSVTFESNTTTTRMLEYGGGDRPIIGRFAFRQLPSPWDTALVEFSLELTQAFDRDTLLVRAFNKSWVDNLVSDTLFYWPGTHRIGDKFSSTLRFVPFASGPGEIIFSVMIPEKRLSDDFYARYGVSFQWCLDENGVLEFLGPSGDGTPVYCQTLDVQFIRDGRVFIRANPDLGYNMLDYLIESDKPIRIGVPITLRVHFKANVDLPKGIRAEITGRNSLVSVASVPQVPVLHSGDSCVFELSFTPRQVVGEHGIIIDIQNLADSTKNQMILCQLLLDNNGNLRYMTDRSWDLPLSLLPASARSAGDAAEKSTITVRLGDKSDL